MDSINILVCSDKNYIMPTAVLIKSLAVNMESVINKSDKDSLTVYILNSDLTENDIENLRCSVDEKSLNIVSLKVNEEDFKDLKVSGHISKSAYYRMLASEILPKGLDRVLYLDCDIIINRSLEELYFTDFEGNYIVSCEDNVISHKDKEVYENLSLPLSYKYFNSGVILFNLELIREIKDFKKKLFDYIEKNKDKFKFHDQDILNGFFNGKVKYAPSIKYNNLVKWITNKKDLMTAYEETAVFHFADKWKPWKHNYIGYADDVFWKYACMTGYKNLYHQYVIKNLFFKIIPFNILRKIKRKLF